mgnify:CR=1 FL=1|jgi:hypothetical protein
MEIAFCQPAYFMSERTGELLTAENVGSSYCSQDKVGTSCLSVPPIITEEVAEAIGEQVDDLGSAVSSAVTSNLLMTVLIGFSA